VVGPGCALPGCVVGSRCHSGDGCNPDEREAELVDVAAAAGHKWLLTPEGVGILYLSDRARERIEPTLVGWTSVPEPGTTAILTSHEIAARYLGNRHRAHRPDSWAGSQPQVVDEHRRGTDCLVSRATDRLPLRTTRGRDYQSSVRGGREKSQIVCIRHKSGRDPMALYRHLKQRNIITAPRGQRLRIAPHVYNTLPEIEELVNSLP